MNAELAKAGAATAGPVIWYVLGVQVPALSVILAASGALLVRVIVITKSKQGASPYNLAVSLLSALTAMVIVTDHMMGVGLSFGVGIACGALGVAIVEIAKSKGEQIFALLFGNGRPPGEPPAS